MSDTAPPPPRRIPRPVIGLIPLTFFAAISPLWRRSLSSKGVLDVVPEPLKRHGPEVREAFLTYQEAIAPHQLIDLEEQSSSAPHSK